MTGRRLAAHNAPVSETGAVLLLLFSAVAFSTAGFFTRMAPVDLAPMVVWRNAFGCLGLAVLLFRSREAVSLTRRGWAAAACSAAATICYLAAFARTSVAEVSVIYATAPLMTTALAWVTLGERPRRRTLGASTLALAGVVVTVSGSARTGTIAGDALALLMTAALSAVAVLARRAALPPLRTAFWSSALAAAATMLLATITGTSLRIGATDALWLAGFGIVTMSLALPAYLMGARRMPAGRTMLISAAELPLGPLWVWLAVNEVPTLSSMVGGAMVLAAIGCDLDMPSRHEKRGAEAPLSELG